MEKSRRHKTMEATERGGVWGLTNQSGQTSPSPRVAKVIIALWIVMIHLDHLAICNLMMHSIFNRCVHAPVLLVHASFGFKLML